jgi:vancomycin resistance protein VanJ
VSLAALLVASVFYLFRFDLVYAFTIYPAWTYAVGGLAIAVAGRPKPFWKAFRWPLVGWLFFVLAFSDEAQSLLRVGSWPTSNWKAARAQGRALRVVSLNCAGGDPLAAAEVGRFDPDIVLFQESPSREEVEAVARKLYGSAGSAVWGPDGSIIARGSLVPSKLPKKTADFVGAIYRAKSGQEVYVVSLRLTPPVLRFDYWNPECWSDYAANLRLRREELRSIVQFAEQNRGGRPLLMGGDFNAGPTPQLASVMPKDAHDSFARAGRGWPYTAVNEWPLVRIDQIWTSESLPPEAVFAQQTVNSDHRMVVCDFVMTAR